MKTYIVTEIAKDSNNVLRSWVCFTEEQAKECLKEHYKIACTCNQLTGNKIPVDCTEHGFFFWTLPNGMEMKYEIMNSVTYAD